MLSMESLLRLQPYRDTSMGVARDAASLLNVSVWKAPRDVVQKLINHPIR
jgi:hypothetical protein